MPAGRAGRGAEVTDDLREWDYGDYEGRRTVDIRQERPGWDLWPDGVPGGETVDDVGPRADRVLDLARATERRRGRVRPRPRAAGAGARWIGLPPVNGGRLGLSTATISVLGWERERPVLHRWNEIGLGLKAPFHEAGPGATMTPRSSSPFV